LFPEDDVRAAASSKAGLFSCATPRMRSDSMVCQWLVMVSDFTKKVELDFVAGIVWQQLA
jgi:hypothetical protein